LLRAFVQQKIATFFEGGRIFALTLVILCDIRMRRYLPSFLSPFQRSTSLEDPESIGPRGRPDKKKKKMLADGCC
jgi:hypothetical protein